MITKLLKMDIRQWHNHAMQYYMRADIMYVGINELPRKNRS